MANLVNKLLTGIKIAGATILGGTILEGCAPQNQVQNYTPVEKARQYEDKNRFQMDFINFGQGSYAIQEPDRYNTKDSLLDENIHFKATNINNLTLEEKGGTSDTFTWGGTPLYFKETTDKIYLGKVDVSRRVRKNKTHLTNRDWKTKTQDFFDETIKIGGIDYLTKKIGNKLYLVEAPRNQNNQKFKEFTNFGTRDYSIQAKQGEPSIYVADISPRTGNNSKTNSLAQPKPVVQKSLANFKASQNTQRNGDFYIVKSNDTFGEICKGFGISFEQGKRLNPQIRNPSLIHPGDTVWVNSRTPPCRRSNTSETERTNASNSNPSTVKTLFLPKKSYSNGNSQTNNSKRSSNINVNQSAIINSGGNTRVSVNQNVVIRNK